jgi:hypothetical protein
VIHQARDRTIWIGTMGGGLDRYDEQRERFVHFTMRNGLADNVVRTVLEDARGRLWIATETALSRFDPATGAIHNYRPEALREAGTLQPHAGIVLADGSFLCGAANGALQFHPDSVRDDAAAPPLAFTRFAVDGVPQPGDLLHRDTVTLGVGEHAVAVDFAALDYRIGEAPEFEAMLDGVQSSWIRLGRRRSCAFASMPSGTHTLRIRATNTGGGSSGPELRVTFIVPPPVYRRWWFLALCGAVLLFALSLLVRWRVARARRRAEYDRRLAESELKALRLQINPHFFFNALGAIQSYVAARDERQASAFIGKFARLMRGILESSRSSTVTVAEEVASLREYLDLESMRFSGRFAYAIDVDPAVDSDLRIPSMLIQPFVENAVRHGLQPLPSGGRLTVSLALRDDAVVCRVEDNGIGRDSARERRERHGDARPSHGMRITTERLEILNAARRRPMRMHVADLRDDAGAPAGTRVEICIPIE